MRNHWAAKSDHVHKMTLAGVLPHSVLVEERSNTLRTFKPTFPWSRVKKSSSFHMSSSFHSIRLEHVWPSATDWCTYEAQEGGLDTAYYEGSHFCIPWLLRMTHLWVSLRVITWDRRMHNSCLKEIKLGVHIYVICQTRKTAFEHVSKQQEEKLKYDA